VLVGVGLGGVLVGERPVVEGQDEDVGAVDDEGLSALLRRHDAVHRSAARDHTAGRDNARLTIAAHEHLTANERLHGLHVAVVKAQLGAGGPALACVDMTQNAAAAADTAQEPRQSALERAATKG
jgi:hypothetical protein